MRNDVPGAPIFPCLACTPPYPSMSRSHRPAPTSRYGNACHRGIIRRLRPHRRGTNEASDKTAMEATILRPAPPDREFILPLDLSLVNKLLLLLLFLLLLLSIDSSSGIAPRACSILNKLLLLLLLLLSIIKSSSSSSSSSSPSLFQSCP